MLHSGCFICQNFDYLMMTEAVNDDFTFVSRCSDKNFIYHVQELLIQILCGLIFDNLLPGQLSLRFVMSEKIKHFHKFHFWDVSFFQQMLVWLPKFQKKENRTGKQAPQNPPLFEDIFLPMHIFIWDVDDVLVVIVTYTSFFIFIFYGNESHLFLAGLSREKLQMIFSSKLEIQGFICTRCTLFLCSLLRLKNQSLSL